MRYRPCCSTSTCSSAAGWCIPRRSAGSAPAGSNPARCASVEHWIAEHRGVWERRLDLLADVLDDAFPDPKGHRSNEHPSARLHDRTALSPASEPDVPGVRRPRPAAALVPGARQLDRHRMVAGLPRRRRRAERGTRRSRHPPPLPQPLPRHRRRRTDRLRLRHAARRPPHLGVADDRRTAPRRRRRHAPGLHRARRVPRRPRRPGRTRARHRPAARRARGLPRHEVPA